DGIRDLIVTGVQTCALPISRHVVRRIFNPIAHHQAFHDLVFNPKIVDVVENLLGPDIQLHHTKLNLKPPSKDARFEWHQDYPFLDRKSTRLNSSHDQISYAV